jgi:hypothetical protein
MQCDLANSGDALGMMLGTVSAAGVPSFTGVNSTKLELCLATGDLAMRRCGPCQVLRAHAALPCCRLRH